MPNSPAPTPWWFVVILDGVIVAYLFFAMYQAHQTPENFTPAFMKTFFGLLLPTLVGAFLLRRRLRKGHAI